MKMELNDGWMLTGSFHRFWEFGKSMELKMELKGIIPWIPASVPGSVHWDLYKAELIPDPYWEIQSLSSEWVNNRDWLYRTEFIADPSWKGKKVRLVCEGVDYALKIRLDGQQIHEHEGMFTPAVVDISPYLEGDKTHSLLLGLSRTPEGVGQLGYTNQVDHLKSRFGYKWDFCPRMVHTGLWKPVYLHVTGHQWIEDVHVLTAVEDNESRVTVRVAVESGKGGDAVVSVSLYGPNSRMCTKLTKKIASRPGLQQVEFEIPISDPRLWWPNGSGDQPLYGVEVRIWNTEEGFSEENPSDERALSIGLRSLNFRQNPDASHDSLPYTIEINGCPIYIKGWNWVPIDQLYGRERTDQYERLISLAKKANINLLRVWGGGLIERELFYDLCDRAGIMVWQEMMQSSSGFNNEPSSAPFFLYQLQDVMRSVIREKRNHPSLVIWCGGNELTEGGHLNDEMMPLSDRFPTLRMLRDLTADLDPERLYLPTSPTGPIFFLSRDSAPSLAHDVHGPWKYAGVHEHYALYNGSRALLHSEYGGDGCASLASMGKFLGDKWLDAKQTGSLPWQHHGYEYWNMDGQLKQLFGEMKDLELQIQLSQWLQAEGIRYGVESNRRRAPQCSGSILWQMNEPFPNVSCTSAVDYYGDPKLVYSWVAKANRSLHLSMQYDRLTFRPDEIFAGDVYLTKDGRWKELLQSSGEAGKLELQIRDVGGQVVYETKVPLQLDDSLASLAGTIRWEIPASISSFYVSVQLRSDADGRLLADNDYAFTVTAAGAEGPEPLKPFLEIGSATLKAALLSEANDGKYRILIENTGDFAALWGRVEGMDGNGQTYRCLDDGWVLFPGETRECPIEAAALLQSCCVYAVNASVVSVVGI